MRYLIAFAACGLLAAAYFLCPDTLKRQVRDTLTPSDQQLAELRDGIEAITSQFDGPGDMGPETPAVRIASADAE